MPALLTYVEGQLRTREFEAQNNGGKRQRTEIIAARVQFLGSSAMDKAASVANDEQIAPTEDTPF